MRFIQLSGPATKPKYDRVGGGADNRSVSGEHCNDGNDDDDSNVEDRVGREKQLTRLFQKSRQVSAGGNDRGKTK